MYLVYVVKRREDLVVEKVVEQIVANNHVDALAPRGARERARSIQVDAAERDLPAARVVWGRRQESRRCGSAQQNDSTAQLDLGP
eukprot:5038190-Prymnesium_polylepis.1